MNEDLIKEMIQEYEQMREMISNRLEVLYGMLSRNSVNSLQSRSNSTDKIKQEITNRRKEMEDQMDRIRAEAMQQVERARMSANNVSGLPGMGGGIPGMPMGGMGRMGMVPNLSAERMKKLNKKTGEPKKNK